MKANKTSHDIIVTKGPITQEIDRDFCLQFLPPTVILLLWDQNGVATFASTSQTNPRFLVAFFPITN